MVSIPPAGRSVTGGLVVRALSCLDEGEGRGQAAVVWALVRMRARAGLWA